MGTAGPLFCARISLHHLQRAGIPAFGCAGGGRALLAGSSPRRYSCRARRAENRQSSHRRAFHGRFAALHFGFTYPQRARSLVVAGCGYGAAPNQRQQFAEEAEAAARRFEEASIVKAAEVYALGPTRVQFQTTDPRGW